MLINVPLNGMELAQEQVERTASAIAGLGTGRSQQSGDSVDLSQEAVSLIQGRDDFELNVKSLQIMDEMTRAALDILA